MYLSEIRPADRTDELGILALYERTEAAIAQTNPGILLPKGLSHTLYAREGAESYIAVSPAGKIVGHSLIQEPDKSHISVWQQAIIHKSNPVMEITGDFVEPGMYSRAIRRSLFQFSLALIRDRGATPMVAVHEPSKHQEKLFKLYGVVEAGLQITPQGMLSFFIFDFRDDSSAKENF
jgi:hypothetical protein